MNNDVDFTPALTKWWLAVQMMSSSKEGASAHQLFRTLGLGSYRTAWFMCHRIREAMRDGMFSTPPLGGKGKVVEADETYIGRKPGRKVRPGPSHKHVVLSLVERGGKARSFHISGTKLDVVMPIVKRNIDKESRLATEEASHDVTIGGAFPEHLTVNHSEGEYVRGDASTNTAEGYFSIFKRGMNGVYQHCGQQHLHRYLAEFDFRYHNRSALGVEDDERATCAMKGIEGKRLTYRQSRVRSN